jgi:adenylate cyclase
MALYLPGIFPGEIGDNMVGDARELIEAATPWIEIGVGLDYGPAAVGNVGSGGVKDFTAVGDVVNTAARLQGVARSGEVVLSRRVATLAGGPIDGAVPRTFELKGKSSPEEAFVIAPASVAAA